MGLEPECLRGIGVSTGGCGQNLVQAVAGPSKTHFLVGLGIEATACSVAARGAIPVSWPRSAKHRKEPGVESKS